MNHPLSKVSGIVVVLFQFRQLAPADSKKPIQNSITLRCIPCIIIHTSLIASTAYPVPMHQPTEHRTSQLHSSAMAEKNTKNITHLNTKTNTMNNIQHSMILIHKHTIFSISISSASQQHNPQPQQRSVKRQPPKLTFYNGKKI